MQKIIQDQFPSLITITPANPLSKPHQINTARIILTETTILIAQDGASGPEILFREDYDPASHVRGAKNSLSTATTLSGKRLDFKKDNNCGCGSRLRSWNPLRSLEQDPK